nr:hypothetical protein [Citrobacter freundii]
MVLAKGTAAPSPGKYESRPGRVNHPTKEANMQSIQQTTHTRYPGLSIEHGEIRQFGKPRHCAANRRGQYQTTLRDQAGRYRTVSIISLYAWEA